MLALWGESDIDATRSDHAVLVQAINARHPERAVFQTIPNTSHGFSLRADMREAQVNRADGPFNSAVVEETLDWLSQHSRKN